ncbi:MAG: hypothetical protein QG591_2666 [Planctomycetota bacterium]|nr:hypothetical protein [Planctomycetota bacterium]
MSNNKGVSNQIISFGIPIIAILIIIAAITTGNIFLWMALIHSGFGSILAGYIAKAKGRNVHESVAIGFLFGIIGAIIVALLPTQLDKNEGAG